MLIVLKLMSLLMKRSTLRQNQFQFRKESIFKPELTRSITTKILETTQNWKSYCQEIQVCRELPQKDVLWKLMD